MTNIKKIKYLQTADISITYHYRCGANYRRLIIDKIQEMEYNSTSEEQILASMKLNDIFKEVFDND